MVYLLAKYTALFLLTGTVAFLFGCWWTRRKYVDVTEGYEALSMVAKTLDEKPWNDMSSSLRNELQSLKNNIAEIPQARDPDFSPIQQELHSLRLAIESIPIPELIKKTDIQSVAKRIDELEVLILNISKEQVNHSNTHDDINVLASSLRNGLQEINVKITEIPQAKEPDFEFIEQELDTIRLAIESILTSEPVEKVDIESDLKPLQQEINTLRLSIESMPKIKQPDLSSIHTRFEKLERTIIANNPTSETVDFSFIQQHIISIEEKLSHISKKNNIEEFIVRLDGIERKLHSEHKSTINVNEKDLNKPGEPRLLSSARFGEKDDLKRISGVGAKLEDMLNYHGVYYFWQVASWSPEDVKIVDDRLETFKGRIERDDWVKQATALEQEPGSAVVPKD